MTGRQLRLFPAPQPLVERLGADFFRDLPRQPGVYWFSGADGRLLYVGKARDLRKRLGFYRNVEGQAPRTARLVNCAAFIRWELCINEAAALERESELIRTYQPAFNRAGKWTDGRKWVWLTLEAERIEMQLEDQAPSPGPWSGTSGQPFGHSCATAFAAWVRLMALAAEPNRSILELPRRLLIAPGPKQWVIETPLAREWHDALAALLAGVPEPLLERLTWRLAPRNSPFELAFVAADSERVRAASALPTAGAG